jgi:nitronate monooxygenase
MADACPASLACAVANAGGMGGLGALTTHQDGIANWVREFRDQSNGGFQINLWIPDPPPVRDPEDEREVENFWGNGPARAGGRRRCRAARLCRAMRSAARGIAWFACVTTLAEARAAEAAGADAIVAQGCEPAATAARSMPPLPSVNPLGVRSRATTCGKIVGADHRDRRDR